MTAVAAYNLAEIWELLEYVQDPEIPVLNVVDMGIVRDVRVADRSVEIAITPTYSGCPAMDMIERDIVRMLAQNGYKDTMISTVLSPPWTTDWLTDEARAKLRSVGIAPPQEASTDKMTLFGEEIRIFCPRCGSDNTQKVSEFGSTACKAHYKCSDCLEPFDYFKCI